MAVRLLCAAITRSTTLNSVRFCVQQRSLFHVRTYDFIRTTKALDTRSLHTKTLDKETNWEAQRAANRQRFVGQAELLEAESQNKHKPSTVDPTITTMVKERETFRPISIEENNNFETNGADADTFGGSHKNDIREDEGDLIEEEYISNPPSKTQRLPQIQYARLIKSQLMAKNIPGAIDVLEKRMKQDRVQPESYTYNLLISGCSKAGYTRKAFSLFNRMRQRGLRITGGTYTSLFNACANAPTAPDGLNRANHVREIMLEKGVEPNLKNYNAMIKAYGRWGDIKTAYQLADEMMEKKIKPSLETFNFLLQACASDTKFGFRHCLLTWHKMLQSGFKPDYYSFNTMLRCVRDCSFGDLEAMQQVLQQILNERQIEQLTVSESTRSQNFLVHGDRTIDEKDKVEGNEKTTTINTNIEAIQKQESSNKFSTKNPFKAIDKQEAKQVPPKNPFKTETEIQFSATHNDMTELEAASEPEPEAELFKSHKTLDVIEIPSNSTISADCLEIPNLLAPRPHLGSMLSLSEITRSHERFLLLGGLNGYLGLMKEIGVTPNIQMFTMILEVIPPTNSAEKQVLSYIRRIGLKADIDFFNVLIKKRSMRFDYEGAKEVISMINTAGLSPDIVTYGVLALGCRTHDEARELLQEMRNKDIRMNIQILGAMLKQGCVQQAFPYICEIMQISLDEHIKPNAIFLRHLHDFYTKCARAIDARHPSTKTKNFKKQHAKFCDKQRLYLEEYGVASLKLNDAIRVIEEGPYQQYKDAKFEGLEPEKNEELVRKQKIRKYIKKIKISNLKGDELRADN